VAPAYSPCDGGERGGREEGWRGRAGDLRFRGGGRRRATAAADLIKKKKKRLNSKNQKKIQFDNQKFTKNAHRSRKITKKFQ
jgi:hypothetical protein